jgi:hypothetical protein
VPERAVGGDGFASDRSPKGHEGRHPDETCRRRMWIASRSSSAVQRRATNAAPSHRGQIRDQRSIAPTRADSRARGTRASLTDRAFFLFVIPYFNTLPPSVIPHGQTPHSEISSFIFIQTSPPSRPALRPSPHPSPPNATRINPL